MLVIGVDEAGRGPLVGSVVAAAVAFPPGFRIEGLTDSKKLSEKKIDGVKLHNLHVLKNTPLEQIYLNGDFEPLSLQEYTRRVGLFLEHLDPNIAVHRLAAVASRWDELLAPAWNREKMRPMQFIEDFMRSKKMYQGRLRDNHQLKN